MRPIFILLFWAISIAACANSGDPVPMGRESYLLSSTGAWSWSAGGALKADLYREANAFCRSQGREWLPVHAVTTDGSFSTFARAEVEFRCLAKDDPALQQPRL
jgi:hypothetical protein